MFIKISITKRLPSGKYRLYSHKKDKSGKRRNLGTFPSLEALKKREKEIQYFKHHADDGETDDKCTKILSKLSDVAAYLEKAGYPEGATKVYSAMDAIDGSLTDDEDYPIDIDIPSDLSPEEWELDLMSTEISPGARHKEKQYKRHIIPMDPTELEELVGKREVAGEKPWADVQDIMTYSKIKKKQEQVYKEKDAKGYEKLQDWANENLADLNIPEILKVDMWDKLVDPVWEVFDADDIDYIQDHITSSNPDVQNALPGSMPYALHGGMGGRPSLFEGQAPVIVGELISKLIKIANKLDKSEHYEEADEIDKILKELLSGEEFEIIEDLEEKEDNKKKKKVEPEEEDKESEDVLVGANGRVGTGVTDNQSAGMFQGFSDSYFYHGPGSIEDNM